MEERPMIAKLTGRLDSVGADWAIIDVAGVGYLVYASGRTLARLGAPGANASLLIDTHVREDHIHLYGFADEGERTWFRLLLTIQGVGAKVALGVLSALAPEQLIKALAAQDKTALIRADGVGAKLATRILTELKDKAAGLVLGPSPAGSAPQVSSTAATPAGSGPVGDAVSALVNLGYGRSEAYVAVMAVANAAAKELPLSELIRLSLRDLGLKERTS